MGSHLPLKVLFVVPYAPTRVRTRSHHLVRALAAHGQEVTLATVWSSPDERAAIADLASSAGLRRVMSERVRPLRSLWNCARATVGSEPLQAHVSWNPHLARRIAQTVADGHVDVVHVEHLRGVPYGLAALHAARGPRAHVPVVWDSVDCISTLFRRAAREAVALRTRLAARFELPRTERYERASLTRFARVVVTSAHDRHDLLQLLDGGHGKGPLPVLEILPVGVDLRHFTPPVTDRAPATLVMTGKMSYHANATAAVWFVTEVLPLVRAAYPGVRTVIVGRNPPREVKRLSRRPNVAVTGTVADVRPFLQAASVAVAPIRYGVGVQNKVLEAMACGTPVVASPEAVAGLQVEAGRHLLVGCESAGFAQAIISLLGDPGRRVAVGLAGRAFVERQHDWGVLAARLVDVYRTAMAVA